MGKNGCCTHLTEGHNPLLLETERKTTEKKMGGRQRTATRSKSQDDTGVRNQRETCTKVQKAVGNLFHVRLTDKKKGKVNTNKHIGNNKEVGVEEVVTER